MKINSKYYPIPNQLPGEKTIFFIHRHWFIFVQMIIVLVFMALLPLIIAFIGIAYIPEIGVYLSGPLIFGFGIYLLFLLSLGVLFWINYYFDIVIITNRRVIEIEQKQLFSRSVSSVELIHIEDISVQVQGFFATVFNYGEIKIQTAGETSNFQFHQIPNPYYVARQLSSLYNQIVKFNGNSNQKNNQFKNIFKTAGPPDDELDELNQRQ